MSLYISRNGKNLGPYDDSQIQDMLANGSITPDVQAWEDGMADWKPLHELRPVPTMSARASNNKPTPRKPSRVSLFLILFVVLAAGAYVLLISPNLKASARTQKDNRVASASVQIDSQEEAFPMLGDSREKALKNVDPKFIKDMTQRWMGLHKNMGYTALYDEALAFDAALSDQLVIILFFKDSIVNGELLVAPAGEITDQNIPENVKTITGQTVVFKNTKKTNAGDISQFLSEDGAMTVERVQEGSISGVMLYRTGFPPFLRTTNRSMGAMPLTGENAQLLQQKMVRSLANAFASATSEVMGAEGDLTKGRDTSSTRNAVGRLKFPDAIHITEMGYDYNLTLRKIIESREALRQTVMGKVLLEVYDRAKDSRDALYEQGLIDQTTFQMLPQASSGSR